MIGHASMPRAFHAAMVLSAGLIAGGCSRSIYANDPPGMIRVGVVYDVGGKDDRSFNAAAWRGLSCAESGKFPDGGPCGKPSLGIIARDVEPGTPVNIEPAMRAFAERNYDLIIGVGFAQAPVMEIV